MDVQQFDSLGIADSRLDAAGLRILRGRRRIRCFWPHLRVAGEAFSVLGLFLRGTCNTLTFRDCRRALGHGWFLAALAWHAQDFVVLALLLHSKGSVWITFARLVRHLRGI